MLKPPVGRVEVELEPVDRVQFISPFHSLLLVTNEAPRGVSIPDVFSPPLRDVLSPLPCPHVLEQ